MKIRIIKNDPIDDGAGISSDITYLIGQVFESTIDSESHAEIFLHGEEFTIFKGEYEIVEE